MTTKISSRPRVKRTRLRAVQRVFYNHDLLEAGTVFDFIGEKLPSEEIAVPVESNEPLGPASDTEPLTKEPPPWTTKGFVDQANRKAGRFDAGVDDDLLN